jgi:hypothetical protein
MPDFNAPAQVFCVEFRTPTVQEYYPKPVYCGTVAKCGRWMISKKNEYPETYYMTVPLEAGFQKTELRFNDALAFFS